MPDIRHRVGITAPADEVYEALSTRDGLARWWTRDVRGESSVGSALSFYFGSKTEPGAVMEVTELAPSERVTWKCSDGASEWVGTELRFELKPGGEGETVILFTHADWREPVEFMHHCSTRWAYFLIGLKHGLEEDAWSPYPDDDRVSSSWR